jgi:hypothetical protein
MHKDVEEAIDQIDAAIFSTDTFYDADDRAKMEEILARWGRELVSIQNMAEDEN